VLVRLPEVDVDQLEVLITEAWRVQAGQATTRPSRYRRSRR
jgi:hypothetical protein